MTDTRKLGEVNVESGILLLGDPSDRVAYHGWKRAWDAAYDRSQQSVMARFRAQQQGVAEAELPAVIRFASFEIGESMVIVGFGGDGTYPVFGEYDESGRLARLTVDFYDEG